MSLGVMVAGIRGATGSTTAATAMRARAQDARFLLSEAPTRVDRAPQQKSIQVG
jgi:hypothetical protein